MIQQAEKLFSTQDQYFKNFEAIGLPNRKTERWKFTPISALYQKDWDSKESFSATAPEGFESNILFNSFGKLEQANGNCQIEELSGDEIAKFLTDQPIESSDALLHWHLSQLSAVYKIKYAGDKPLSITHSLGSNCLTNYALILELENENAIVLENFIGGNLQAFHQTSRFLDLKKNQNIKHVLVNEATNEQSQQVWTYANQNAQNSSYQGLQAYFGGGFCRSNPYINVQKPKCFSEFNAFYFLEGSEHFDFYSQIKHLCGETESNQIVKGLLHDEAKFAFTGNIFIAKDSQLVNAAQFNKNLVMSKKAQAFGQPQLEIYADDVKCSHGSTTGQFDVDELFYLNARGISAAKAKRLMAQAYGIEIFQKVKNEQVSQYLENKLIQKLKKTYGN